jgi:hypothetical protein
MSRSYIFLNVVMQKEKPCAGEGAGLHAGVAAGVPRGASFDTDQRKQLHWLRFRFHHVMIMVMIMVMDDHHVVLSHHVRLSHFLHRHFRILRKGWDCEAERYDSR